jgi:hypothetical protein
MNSHRKNVSDRQVRRLVSLASNFAEALKPLPARKREEYLSEQREVADTRRRAQTSERLLRLRVK